MHSRKTSCRASSPVALVLVAAACALNLQDAAAIDRATVPEKVARDETVAPPLIEPYEPNVLGFTKQSDDVGFADIQLSMKYRLFRQRLWKLLNPGQPLENMCDANDRQRLYLTFTGRAGFYVGSRDSGPVIAKNYNPKLLWRYIRNPDLRKDADISSQESRQSVPKQEYAGYVDFAYAHDSNGQTIDNEAAYSLAQHNSRDSRFALDQVSRGWDYVQVEGKYTFSFNGSATDRLSVYPGFKFFLRHGFLQGVPEEYHSFEHAPAARPRHAYDGLTLSVEYRPNISLVTNPRLSVQYKTGYAPLARYNTVRGEFGFYLLELPIAIYVEDGYMTSLARYYEKARSYGVQLRIAE